MTLHRLGQRLLSPRATGLWGLATLVALLGGVLLSLAAFPGYAVIRGYISELADPANTGRHWFTLGLVLGGLFLLLFALGLARLLPNRPGRITAWLLGITALSLPAVAYFPFTQPIPHLVAAIFLFGSTIFATLYAALAFRHAATEAENPAAEAEHPGPLRTASRLAWAVLGIQVASTLAGLAFTVYLVTRMPLISVHQLLADLPAYQLVRPWPSGPVINPAALLEWVFFFTALALFAVASILALRTKVTSAV